MGIDKLIQSIKEGSEEEILTKGWTETGEQVVSANGNKYHLFINAEVSGGNRKEILEAGYSMTRDDGKSLESNGFEVETHEGSIKDGEMLLLKNNLTHVKFFFYSEIWRDCDVDLAPRNTFWKDDWGNGMEIKIKGVTDTENDKKYLMSRANGGPLTVPRRTYMEVGEFPYINELGLNHCREEYFLPETRLLSKTDEILSHYV